jgi:hypothetical protein
MNKRRRIKDQARPKTVPFQATHPRTPLPSQSLAVLPHTCLPGCLSSFTTALHHLQISKPTFAHRACLKLRHTHCSEFHNSFPFSTKKKKILTSISNIETRCRLLLPCLLTMQPTTPTDCNATTMRCSRATTTLNVESKSWSRSSDTCMCGHRCNVTLQRAHEVESHSRTYECFASIFDLVH